MKPPQIRTLLSTFGAALLFVLSVPVVMQYRIFPVDGTSYVVFLLFFLLNIANIIFCLSANQESKKIDKVKSFFTWSIIGIAFVGAMWTAIADRGKIAPGQNHQTHDIILQLESAIKYVTDGKNPYKENYFGTPMESWHYGEAGKDAINPALYHFVMPPWYLLSSYPFYFVSMRTLGYFDGRMPLLFAVVGSLVVIFFWIKNKDIARIAISLIAFNPAMIAYVIEGRSDFVVFFWFVLSLFLIDRKKIMWAALALAAAIMTKQTVWFAVPIVVFYLWIGKYVSVKKILLFCFIVGFFSMLVAMPFLLWDAKAFVDSVVFYLAGNSEHSYPISGYGLGMLFLEGKIITDSHAYYPFALWQALLGIPAFVLAMGWLKKYQSISGVFMVHALTLFVIWYASRYFNNSHVAYISLLFLTGVLKYIDESVSI